MHAALSKYRLTPMCDRSTLKLWSMNCHLSVIAEIKDLAGMRKGKYSTQTRPSSFLSVGAHLNRGGRIGFPEAHPQRGAEVFDRAQGHIKFTGFRTQD